MALIGFSLAIVMGLILGLLGGGGSILTVPILVYFFGVSAVMATGYSLLVVGLTSLVGAARYYKDDLIDFRIAFLFSVPSMVGVFISRKFLLPALPDAVSLFSSTVTKDQFIMGIFALLVLAISGFMFKAKEVDRSIEKERPALSKKSDFAIIIVGAFLMACLTGFVGAGGGFMIVPALMLLANVPLRKAIATSLVIISFKSLAGFVGDLSEGLPFDWHFLSIFIGITMIGVFLGAVLNKRIPAPILRKGFAYFVFVMGLFIVVNEIF
ncbi:MAG: putative membrane protein YfcA [Candidatus Marinamargulisbacteria bacterium]|jgi:uncharacterized membrane protein YfcA